MPSRPDPREVAAATGRVRLQRVLAAAGIAARRAAEELIEEGRVEVNGRVVSTLPAFVDPENDRITVDGRPLPKAQRPAYIMVNKPERMLTVASDEPGMDRATVMDLVTHPAKPRLFPVGRLDWMTTGLVLLTNDGPLANRLTHPRYGVEKVYRALVRGQLDPQAAEELQQRLGKAIRKDDRLARRPAGAIAKPAGKPPPRGGGRVQIEIEGYDEGRTSLLITVREGRTGNIAKMLTAAGASVRKLERIAIGPLQLRGLPRAGWRELERREINALKAAARGDRPAASRAAPRPTRPVPKQSAGSSRRSQRSAVPMQGSNTRSDRSGRTRSPQPASRGTRPARRSRPAGPPRSGPPGSRRRGKDLR